MAGRIAPAGKSGDHSTTCHLCCLYPWLCHKFTFLSRTTPIKDPLLQLVEDIIRTRLLPAWTGRAPPSDIVRELFTLPARLGGLGIIHPASRSSKEFLASVSISAPLSHLVESQQSNYPWEALETQMNAKQSVLHQRSQVSKFAAAHIKFALSDFTEICCRACSRERCLLLSDLSSSG